ncbi:rhodanese-like domain-containing protein 6 isoform X2 [Punica granatum]|uniref:Rhodanese-like domain-containing protein 6 isoform X2 n=1 Tax=Punica granatum TaxID=22663 RepID=A0A6P8DV29_PUNGR|nr:rhodanese-like domain-containing protein 6 isoform X2 [Punica granatum]
MADDAGEGEQYGLLLYYKYASVPDLDELVSFYQSNCSSLGLLGRVRVAPHGVNVTVGGKLSSLEKHIEAVKARTLFEGTDFKLASSHQPLNDRVAKECGFTSLSVRIVDELVTFSSHPLLKSPNISNAGRHLSAVEFHSVLESAGKILEESGNDNEGLVLLDARNLYETRIGKFQSPDVETLDPEIRQYSDLHSWIDDNADRLQGKNILMYCTGGIRCEMASAYIRGKGTGFENVFQLYGGIQRYLDQFPDGGFFRGKNFVFDHRISVGSSDPNILGTCLLCGCCFDDYSARCRCAYCRMLVLVCDNCRVDAGTYVCELCQKHGKGGPLVSAVEDGIPEESLQQIDLKTHPCPRGIGFGSPRKLRILCLHGFRQNASSFKGRTASLAKKIKNIAELIYVDGPHELPFIYQPPVADQACDSESSAVQRSPPRENCKKKLAWLVSPECCVGSGKTEWIVADGPFDLLQYQQQTGGSDISLAHLKKVFSQDGPFDGILGFSQGAAMATLACAHQDKFKGEMNFRFAVLCSGYLPKIAEISHGTINCPSLHIFGSDHGKDRQISNTASKDLATYFEEGSSVIIQHDSGHIIPTRSPYIDQIKDFLHRFI